MRRASLYSPSQRPRSAARSQTSASPSSSSPSGGSSASGNENAEPNADPPGRPSRMARIREAIRRRERLLTLAGAALIALAIVHGDNLLHPLPKPLTQEDIDG